MFLPYLERYYVSFGALLISLKLPQYLGTVQWWWSYFASLKIRGGRRDRLSHVCLLLQPHHAEFRFPLTLQHQLCQSRQLSIPLYSIFGILNGARFSEDIFNVSMKLPAKRPQDAIRSRFAPCLGSEDSLRCRFQRNISRWSASSLDDELRLGMPLYTLSADRQRRSARPEQAHAERHCQFRRWYTPTHRRLLLLHL